MARCRSTSSADGGLHRRIHQLNRTRKHLANGASLYDAVIALPYLYGVVVRAVEVSRTPIHLIPCLHDEAYARIPRIEDAFHRAQTLLFNSAGEAELALRLFGPGILSKSHVVGTGIPPPSEVGASPVAGAYYLYLGRREPEKGIESLLEAFQHYRSNGSQRDVSLVLAGPGQRSYEDDAAGVRDLGFVDEATKRALLQNAIALVNPSKNESYSRVLMEAWREETPVIAHAQCLATATAVRESKGGLVAGTSQEWVAAFVALGSMGIEERRQMGKYGANYAGENADWDKAIDRLRTAIRIDSAFEAAPKRNKRIDQVLEAIDAGDAISDHAKRIRARLRRTGYESDIYAANIAPGFNDARALHGNSLNREDAIIFHHSIGSAAADAVGAVDCRKAMIYHNITPGSFFAEYAPDVANQLERGREQLPEMIARFDLFVGDSDYNARELSQLGAQNVRTLPVIPELRRFDCSPAEGSLRPRRGSTWLFVGRIAPNKGIAALIDAFVEYLRLDNAARLVIVGKFDPSDTYYNELRRSIDERGIDPFVTFTGYVDDAKMVGRYRSADVFVCMSEHEGFCVPLVEAMFFDIPIVAKALTAVPETLGNAGLLLDPEADAFDTAALVYEVCTNAELRTAILDAQRDRRRAFLPDRVDPLIDALAANLVHH